MTRREAIEQKCVRAEKALDRARKKWEAIWDVANDLRHKVKEANDDLIAANQEWAELITEESLKTEKKLIEAENGNDD
jgi:hypothetical protein